MTKPRVIYTNQCSDGIACRSTLYPDGSTAYIPDGQSICNNCLLVSVGLNYGTYDRCGDPLGMHTLYSEEDVITALRGLGLG